MDGAALPLADWESFYVIVGSSGAALTGLQFVVITLGADADSLGGERELNAFGTPTVVHFCAALMLSAVVSAPWHRLGSAAVVLGACGAGGLVYTAIVSRRSIRQTGYKPVLEDWVWHSIVPTLAYAALFVASVILPFHPGPALFVVGTVSLLLLFAGIHNAWDAVIYLAIKRRDRADGSGKSG